MLTMDKKKIVVGSSLLNTILHKLENEVQNAKCTGSFIYLYDTSNSTANVNALVQTRTNKGVFFYLYYWIVQVNAPTLAPHLFPRNHEKPII